MAAAAKKQENLSDSSSSEDDEEALQRLREAAWKPSIGFFSAKTSPFSAAEPSLSLHEDDGNELRTTAGFRDFVAKRLGAILDSAITPWERPSGPARNDPEDSGTEEDGFRLFSSSLPGDDGNPKPSPSSAGRRRRERSRSSSSSDQEWQRFREAAVTAADVLKHSGLPGGGDAAAVRTAEPGERKKRKKKKVRKNGAEDAAETSPREDPAGDCANEENGATADASRRKKREEKKRKKLGGRAA